MKTLRMTITNDHRAYFNHSIRDAISKSWKVIPGTMYATSLQRSRRTGDKGDGPFFELFFFVELVKEEDDWLPIESAPADGSQFLAYGEELIDEDFNPEGIALCSWADMEPPGWYGTVWDGQFDHWDCRLIKPTHWKPINPPVKNNLA